MGQKSVMTDANLYTIFRSRFGGALDRPFVELPDGTAFTYRDAEARSGRYANLLTAMGVEPGDRIAVQVEKSVEGLFLYLGVLRAGGVYLPLNTAYRSGEVGYFLGDAEPRVFVCDPAREAEAAGLAGESCAVLTLGADGEGTLTLRASDQSEDFATVARTPDDLAAICYTSGTTGRSKGAMLAHGNLASNAQVVSETWGFTADDVLLHALPMFHVHGLFVATHCVLMSASRMLFLPKFDAAEVVRLMPRATVMMGVPTFYTRLLGDDGFTGKAAKNMRLFISGSAPLLEETFNEFEARTGHRILERYGMTEIIMHLTNPLHGERRPGTVGKPFPGSEIRIADEAGAEVARGEIGVLEVRGPNLFKGYWRMPEKTAEEFRPGGWFITGDVARLDESGYVQIVGRAKDLIITGGYNVYPKEVEAVIDAIDGVEESAVIGVPHADFGEAVTAVVKRRAGSSGPDEAAVIAAVKATLANFKVPKRVFFTDELPRNAMGKVQKNLLRETYAGEGEAARP
jgi:malonyl-CoA/methylmalonyl-CoA synthetase